MSPEIMYNLSFDFESTFFKNNTKQERRIGMSCLQNNIAEVFLFLVQLRSSPKKTHALQYITPRQNHFCIVIIKLP